MTLRIDHSSIHVYCEARCRQSFVALNKFAPAFIRSRNLYIYREKENGVKFVAAQIISNEIEIDSKYASSMDHRGVHNEQSNKSLAGTIDIQNSRGSP